MSMIQYMKINQYMKNQENVTHYQEKDGDQT